MRRKVEQAPEKLASSLGLSTKDVKRVESRFDLLAHELSYIAGLRDRFHCILDIQSALERLAAEPQRGQLTQDNVTRVRVLLSYAVKRLSSEFELMDKQNLSLTAILRDPETHTDPIRSIRNEIHYSRMAWQAFDPTQPDQNPVPLIEQTYRFLAQNYPIAQVR